MHPAYQHVAVADLQPGMVLSDEIVDKQGQVLLPEGTVLTPKIIALLPSHDVGMVAVRADIPGQQIDSAAISARIDQLFRKNDPDNADDWATGILRRYVLDYRLNREVE